MRHFDRRAVLSRRDDKVYLEALRRAFIDAELGKYQATPGLHLAFDRAHGECHVKAASGSASRFFVVKLACGFYHNGKLGLPNSDGVSILGCARSGQLIACIEDGGWLTDLRTALTGLLAAEALLAAPPQRIAILGSGVQAQLHAQVMRQRWPMATIKLWGRSSESRTRAIGSLLRCGVEGVEGALSPQDACLGADLVVTATPAKRPIIDAASVPAAATIIAVGSDGPGKQELDPQLFAGASEVVVDMALDQNGGREVRHALAKGLVAADEVKSLGRCLAARGGGQNKGRGRRIADLTGSPVADLAICATFFTRAVGGSEVAMDL